VVRPRSVETTALGSAMLAGLAVGFWKGLEEIRKTWSMDRRFTPQLDERKKQEMLSNWKKAIRKT